MNEEAEKQTKQYMTKLEDDEVKGYRLQIFSRVKNEMIDISTLVGDITHSTSMLDNPGKLTFFVQKDPNGIVNNINNGDKVFFKKDNIGIFCGYVFTVGMDATEVFKITAYDQTRYLKNEDTVLLKNMSVSQIFEKFCIENKLNYKIITPINFIPPAKIYQNKTIYSILRDCISLAENDSAKQGTPVKYMIRDNYGVLELRSVESLKTNIIIGEESLLSSYQFESSIDKSTYTQIKVVKNSNNNELKESNMTVTLAANKEAQKVWGILQKVVQANENVNKAQAKALAQQWLKLTCRETKTLSLSALGILGMDAGYGFRLKINALNANLDMYTLNATHKYSNNFHTMDLEVNANDLELYYK